MRVSVMFLFILFSLKKTPTGRTYDDVWIDERIKMRKIAGG